MTERKDWLGLAGRHVVITGGAAGIGYGIAECFVGQGAAVLVLDQDAAACEQAAQRLGGTGRRVHGLACDVSDPVQVRAAADRMLDLLGPCDVLVNNAAVQRTGPLATLDPRDWCKVLDVNLTGALLCAQAFGRHMLERKNGSMVHIASIAARFPQPSGGAYGPGKAALLMMSQGLALEWGHQGVRSNCVSPGATGSGMASRMVAGEGVAAARNAQRHHPPGARRHARRHRRRGAIPGQ